VIKLPVRRNVKTNKKYSAGVKEYFIGVEL